MSSLRIVAHPLMWEFRSFRSIDPATETLGNHSGVCLWELAHVIKNAFKTLELFPSTQRSISENRTELGLLLLLLWEVKDSVLAKFVQFKSHELQNFFHNDFFQCLVFQHRYCNLLFREMQSRVWVLCRLICWGIPQKDELWFLLWPFPLKILRRTFCFDIVLLCRLCRKQHEGANYCWNHAWFLC